VTTFRSRQQDERGAAAVIMSVLLVSGLLFGMGALAVDLGQMYEMRRQAQTAADLAATAGGGLLQENSKQACQEAVKYLRDNDPTGPDLDVMPVAADCTDAGSTPDDMVDANGDGIRDSPVVEVQPGGKLRVIVPRQKVKFGFATALGFSGSDVTAAATVALKSVGGAIGPFAIPAGCVTSTNWYFSIKSGPSNDPGSSSCSDPTSGSFGWLSLRHNGTDNNGDLGDDVNQGADHAIGYVKGVDPNYLGEASATAPDCNGVIPTSDGGVYYTPKPDSGITYASPDMPNCVAIGSGNIASISDDLVGKSSTCTDPTQWGRLNDLTGPSGTKFRSFSPCNINGYRLTDFLVAGDGNLAPVKAGTRNVLRSEIVDNPNFFVVPIIFATGRPTNKVTPVVGFRGLFLDCFDTTCTNPFGNATSGSSIHEINGYIFDLKTVVPPPNAGGSVESYYTGTGVAVPVLVPDQLN
jgi:hypothetical protein